MLPEGFDASDFLDRLGDSDDLVRLGRAAPEMRPPNRDDRGLGGTVRLVWASDIEPERIEWLWQPLIPRGALTLLAGDPGIGKSWVGCAITAAVSLGLGLPRTGPAEPGKALYVTGEDHVSKTLRPRLEALGADLDAVAFLLEGSDGELPTAHVPALSTEEGRSTLEAAIVSSGAILVILDPVQAFQGGALDVHRVNEVRAFMQPLAAIAERLNVAIVLVAHLSKTGTRKAAMRVLGSVDHTAAARSVLVAGADPDNPSDRALFHVKANLGPQADPLGYSIERGAFSWKSETALTVGRALGEPGSDEDRSAVDEAVEWLREVLASGPMLRANVERAAKCDGIAWPSVKRATVPAGVRSVKPSDVGLEAPSSASKAWTLTAHDGRRDPFGSNNALEPNGPTTAEYGASNGVNRNGSAQLPPEQREPIENRR